MRRWCLLVLFTLAGCAGSFFETKILTPTTYVLAPAKPGVAATPLGVDLAIAIPAPAPGLDTERIATLHESRRLDYYKDTQWGATAANVMQSLLVTTLQNQRLFRSVTAEQARVNATHVLDLQLQDFQAEYADDNAAPTVRVALTASLIRLKDRALLASFPAAATVAATENRLSAVIAAFESAAQQAALSVGAETSEVLKKQKSE